MCAFAWLWKAQTPLAAHTAPALHASTAQLRSYLSACPLTRALPTHSARLGVKHWMEWNLRRMESELRQINPDLLQPSKSFKKPSSGTITINVGGYMYAAQRHTLTKHPGSLLEEIVTGRSPWCTWTPWATPSSTAMAHLPARVELLAPGRTGAARRLQEAELLRREAAFYRLSELAQALQDWEQRQATQREPAFPRGDRQPRALAGSEGLLQRQQLDREGEEPPGADLQEPLGRLSGGVRGVLQHHPVPAFHQVGAGLSACAEAGQHVCVYTRVSEAGDGDARSQRRLSPAHQPR